MADVCIRMCDCMHQIPLRILCIIIALLQGSVLNYYLVKHKNVSWYAWIVADIAILLLIVTAFIISYKHLKLARKSPQPTAPIQRGSLPLAYIVWFVNSVILAARVAIIFRDFAWQLDEDDFFSPNTLKINISMAAFVLFLLLLLSHHDAGIGMERKHAIVEITGIVVFDILDSIDILDIMFEKSAIDNFPAHLDTAILIIACVNLVLPTLPLMTLSKAHFGHRFIPREITILHKVMIVFFVNLPLLAIRLVLRHLLSQDISIFPVKNLIVIFLVFHYLYEKRREDLKRQEADNTDGVEENHEIESPSMEGFRLSCK